MAYERPRGDRPTRLAERGQRSTSAGGPSWTPRPASHAAHTGASGTSGLAAAGAARTRCARLFAQSDAGTGPARNLPGNSIVRAAAWAMEYRGMATDQALVRW